MASNPGIGDNSLQSESEEATIVGRWLGYDPRDDDWHCNECQKENPNGPPHCGHCGHPHVLTSEELAQVEQLEKLPDEIFAGALLGEYKRNSSIDSCIEYLRQWGKAIVQKIVANGQGYALVGFETKAEEAGLIEQMVIAGFENVQSYDFPQRSLCEITQEILKEKFQENSI
ncbi:hypothetical protein DdX_11699 [Ditylenchus destructor]|uniref:RanBP2-type domain-containing protein n=1 Tax=Ditylenchus destructor TaxID=166010 RepID=A0AAD4MXK8_9BILA|nr:hypothetical protein DdX_11699 [Ditylenchus destructor]